jgi:hypothetical protein
MQFITDLATVQSSKLLLAQLFVVLGTVGIHEQIFVCSKTVYMFGNGVSSSGRGGLHLSE